MGNTSTRAKWMLKWEATNPLRVWRTTYSISREHVATTVGVSYMSVRSWELGFVVPDLDRMDALADLMGEKSKQLQLDWAQWRNTREAFMQRHR